MKPPSDREGLLIPGNLPPVADCFSAGVFFSKLLCASFSPVLEYADSGACRLASRCHHCRLFSLCVLSHSICSLVRVLVPQSLNTFPTNRALSIAVIRITPAGRVKLQTLTRWFFVSFARSACYAASGSLQAICECRLPIGFAIVLVATDSR